MAISTTLKRFFNGSLTYIDELNLFKPSGVNKVINNSKIDLSVPREQGTKVALLFTSSPRLKSTLQ